MSATSAPKPWGNRIVVGASCLTAAVLLLANWPAVQATLTVFWETGAPAQFIRLLATIGGFIAFLVLFIKVSDRFEERRKERAELVALQIVVHAILDSGAVDPAAFPGGEGRAMGQGGEDTRRVPTEPGEQGAMGIRCILAA